MSCLMTKPTKWHVHPANSDQRGHPPSLIRVLAVRMKKAWALSYPLSAQRRLVRLGGYPGWFESSLGAHSFCCFCHVMAQMLMTWPCDGATMKGKFTQNIRFSQSEVILSPLPCICCDYVTLQVIKWKKKKTTSNAMLMRSLPTTHHPRRVMVNKENYYQEYKGHTKWLSLISSSYRQRRLWSAWASESSLGAHSLCWFCHVAAHIFIVCAKYQKASVKALVQVDFTVYAL